MAVERRTIGTNQRFDSQRHSGGFWEAIEVIEYQEAMRAERDKIRKNVWWRRLIRKITGRKEPE